MDDLAATVRALIRDVPDFPKKGIVYKDITPVLQQPHALREISTWLAAQAPADVDVVVGIESRGFLFASSLCERLGASFVPVRKPGKLPWKTLSTSYALEYGESTLSIHVDAIQPGQRVLILDDLLATGGTAAAAAALCQRLGGVVVGATFLVELTFLKGRSTLDGIPVQSLVSY